VSALALLLVPTLPLALLALACVPAQRARVARLAPWAALPALLLALAGGPADDVALRWMLLGSVLGVDAHTRVFLAFTALLWLAAGLHARGHLRGDARRDRFNVLWLATMAGNFGLIVARDVATFYTAFALMTFAAYGLVIHTGSREALRAGRVYLAMAVLGEGLIVAGLLMAASLIATPLLPTLAQLAPAIAAAPQRDLIIACLWLGFGIKAGLPLLHMWLPLAHPVAPVPASAVLSGAMIKAGLLGWLNTLPLGLASLPAWGTLAMVAGLGAAFGAALIGIHQQSAKTVLAYSSVSQMGLITVGIGAGLVAPALWPLLAPAVALYALHHGLAKGALFLGVAVAHQPGRRVPAALLWLALALPGLSLAGLMTSGVLAKLTLKAALAAGTATPGWWALLPGLLAVAAVGTTALVARYLWLLRSEQRQHAAAGAAAGDVSAADAGQSAPPVEPATTGASGPAAGACAPPSVWLGWGLLLAASSFAFVLLPPLGLAATTPAAAADVVALAWPVLLGVVLSVAASRWLHAWPIPAGDVLAWLGALAAAVHEAGGRLHGAVTGFAYAAVARRPAAWLRRHARRWREFGGALEHLWRREAALVFAAVLVAVLFASLAAGR
jgi:formate hydrogenlyase subunit 3/multisubunit Na+/H+ antiporter MnhD subunit